MIGTGMTSDNSNDNNNNNNNNNNNDNNNDNDNNKKLRVLPCPRDYRNILHEINMETIKINENDLVSFIVRNFNYLKQY